MTGQSPNEVTQLLHAWGSGDRKALDELMQLLYGEVHRLAHRYLRHERAGHTLQSTALVNETHLKLVGSARIRWQDCTHYLAMSARLMRRFWSIPCQVTTRLCLGLIGQQTRWESRRGWQSGNGRSCNCCGK